MPLSVGVLVINQSRKFDWIDRLTLLVLELIAVVGVAVGVMGAVATVCVAWVLTRNAIETAAVAVWMILLVVLGIRNCRP